MRSLRPPADDFPTQIPRSTALEHHQKNTSLLDGSTVTIIIIAVIVVVWAYFARHLHDFTKSRSLNEVEFHATVEGRIEPFGRVRLPGEEMEPGDLQVDEVPAAQPVAATKTGPQVFNEACNLCHGNGIGGAPMLTAAADWEARVAQGTETLYEHALAGYTGNAGYMPPKGGRMDLSDQEIKDAVDYMLSQIP
jgi:cytochrome c5